MVDAENTVILCVNGEIYNHLELRKLLPEDTVYQTHSDCEVIIHLYKKFGADFVHQLRGMFSFTLYDKTQDRWIVARDPMGITTLYQGFDTKSPSSLFIASEMKSLQSSCDKIDVFPPGHVYDSKVGEHKRYYSPDWWVGKDYYPTNALDLKALRESLEQSVRRRLMTEVPYGVLLSGGLDSSLIASIAVRELERAKNDPEDDTSSYTGWPKLHSFSVGLPGAPDLKAAKEVAKFIGTRHHEFTFTIEEGHDALKDVIYHLETYDVTTIRASTPMYLLSRKIKAMGVKMVLSGEGSDEIFGGYLYFHQAPDAKALHDETVSRVSKLHLADNLRANKSTMAWGLEARVPFLDVDFLEVAMNVDPEEKLIKPGRIEKYIIRKAFDDKETPYLPDNILWRQKEQFSDGVGYSWIDSLRDRAQNEVSDEQFATAAQRWPVDTPDTKEAFWYRSLFDELFPNPAAATTVERWIPRKDWGCSTDPSGRAQKVHEKAY